MWNTVSEEEMKKIKDAFKSDFSGYRFDCESPIAGHFSNLNSKEKPTYSKWWTSYEINENNACAFSSHCTSTGIVYCNSEYNEGENKGMGFPVRCVLDKTNK